jgi:predicted glycosyltransferase
MLAEALSKLPESPDILLISGTYEAGAFEIPPGIELITLPAYAKSRDGGYSARRMRMKLSELRDVREGIIHAALKRIAPSLLIVDNVPLGAEGEVERALKMLRRRGGTRVVLGCRDVLDDRNTVRSQWLKNRHLEAIDRYFDQVWVYGDPSVYDVMADCGFESLGGKAVHTGYLLKTPPKLPAGIDRRTILCTVGGGRDGVALCDAFAEARMPAGRRGLIVLGTQMSAEDAERITGKARHNGAVDVLPFASDLLPIMAGADRIVAMGGYNTSCEILAIGRPALIVPRTAPRREQIIRATRFAEHGLIDMLHPRDLSPAALSDWLSRPVSMRSPDTIDTDGLGAVASLARAALSPIQTCIAAE